jgi:hypothetical protein
MATVARHIKRSKKLCHMHIALQYVQAVVAAREAEFDETGTLRVSCTTYLNHNNNNNNNNTPTKTTRHGCTTYRR